MTARASAASRVVAELPFAALGACAGRITSANSAAASLLGATSPAELLGRSIVDVADAGPDRSGPDRLAAWLQSGAGGASVAFRLRRPDGQVVDVEACRVATAEPAGGELLVVLRDLTAQRAAEARLAAERDLALALPACDTPQQAFGLLLEAALATPGLSQGVVALGAGDDLTVLATGGLEPEAAAVLVPGTPLHDPDGVGSILGLALVRTVEDGRELGTLHVGPAGPGGPTEEMLQHLRALAAICAATVSRLQDRTALQEHEARRLALIEALEEGVLCIDRRERVTAANAAARRILGLAPDLEGEALAAACHQVEMWREDGRPIPPEQRPWPDGLSAASQVVGVRMPGAERPRWLRVSTAPDSASGAQPPTRAIITFRDITVERLREQTARLCQRLTEQALHHGARHVMRLALDGAASLSGSTAGALHLVTGAAKALVLEAACGQAEPLAGGPGTPHVPLLADEADPWQAALRSGQMVVHDRAARVPGSPLELTRVVVVPLQSGGITRALWTLGGKPGRYDSDECEAVATVAQRLWEVVEVKRLDAVVQAAEERYQRIVALASEGIIVVDEAGLVTLANDRMKQWLGYPDHLLLGRELLGLVHPDELAAARAAWEERTPGLTKLSRLRLIRSDGNVVWLQLSAVPFAEVPGQPSGWFAMAVNLTEQRRQADERELLQQQLADARRLETVGQLAGGIAHDLNNVLAPVLGYSELLLGSLAHDDAARADLNEIAAAAERAKQLVQQLLAFARRQALEVQPLHLNAVVNGLLKMLRRTIREDVQLVPHLAAELPVVRADLLQLEQVLLNLVINAQDAMPEGGRLTIATETVQLDAGACRRLPGALPGRYVVLSVADTGVGMSEDTRSRAFEPFGTAQASGPGTGLGLATVYGIVKQHNGLIDVDSRPGEGTSYRCYFRASADDAALPAGGGPTDTATPEEARRATVLVVDDQLDMLRVAEQVLRRAGYHVIGCTDPRAAIKVASSSPHLDLLLTDLVMPSMNGLTLSRWLTGSHPSMRTLCMTGYADEVAQADGEELHDAEFLFKPFSPAELTDRIRDILARPRVA